MNEKTKLYKIYGVILNQICAEYGFKKKELHRSLKIGYKIDSLTTPTKKELYEYIQEVIAHFATSYGFDVLEDNKTLKELFNEH